MYSSRMVFRRSFTNLVIAASFLSLSVFAEQAPTPTPGNPVIGIAAAAGAVVTALQPTPTPTATPTPTPPAGKACLPGATGTALVIIDMQEPFATRGGKAGTEENKKKLSKIEKAQLDAIHAAKAANIPIIFVEYDGYGATNDPLIKAAGSHKLVTTVSKNTDGMFESYNKHRGDLVDYCQKNKIGNLIITGANGGACVRDSIETALKEDCNVIAHTHGIADFNYDDFIYPYTGKYDDIKKSAEANKKATFTEVTSLESVLPAPKSHRSPQLAPMPRQLGSREVLPPPREVGSHGSLEVLPAPRPVAGGR